jgi:deoxyribonuclease V
MIACVDVDYRPEEALAAAVLFDAWTDTAGWAERTEPIRPVAPYQPGQFFRRELPCLLAVLGKAPSPPDVVVIDGYVWLADESRPGLGAHLFEALGRTVPVIGVAKTAFQGATAARPVWRGVSRRPLYVSAAGMDVEGAARCIQAMHGAYRIPTLLRRVDQLCRTA